MNKNTIVLICFVIFTGTIPVLGQTEPEISQAFDKMVAEIEMRDGVRLYTEIYKPKKSDELLPILLLRTPYGFYHGDKVMQSILDGPLKDLVDDGYIFVFQDIRGCFKSGGEFVILRPLRDKTNPDDIDESTDAYESIEWLLTNIPENNGRVGIWGTSYDGWLAVMAMIDPHPAIKAVSPQAACADMFMGDDFFHNGALRLSPSFEFLGSMEAPNQDEPFRFDQYDTYEWYLELGPLSAVNEKYFYNNLPTWNDLVAHTTYDKYWQSQEVTQYLTNVSIPTLNVAGWWDDQDFYGAMKIYETLEHKDTSQINYLVAGPWRHSGWISGDGTNLGQIDFGSATGTFFREKILAPWFAFYLKDKGTLDLPGVLAFQTGTNDWKSYEEWPPKDLVSVRNLYFREDGKLSFEPPLHTEQKAFDSYISDPANPVPYTKRPIKGFWGYPEWKFEDQRFVDHRPDVLSWETDVLDTNVVISGRIIADLFASTSGTDCDWVVKLIDVYPENYPPNLDMGGYQLMIADEVFRAKFRNSFTEPEPLISGKVTEFNIDLNSRNHTFLKGHKIMVQIQSTWFPLIDRNPQKFINIPTAREEDFQKATQCIFRSNNFPTHIKLPVIKLLEKPTK